MKCASCGVECAEGVRFCSMCGKPLSPPVVTPGVVESRHCVGCGRVMPWDANVCQYCGYDYRAKPKADKTRERLTTGAVLTLLAGIFSVLLLTIIIVATEDGLGAAGWALAVLIYICAFLGIAGGLMAIMRMSYPLAVLGAACSIMGPAFFFGIPGLILIAQSSREFERPPAQ